MRQGNYLEWNETSEQKFKSNRCNLLIKTLPNSIQELRVNNYATYGYKWQQNVEKVWKVIWFDGDDTFLIKFYFNVRKFNLSRSFGKKNTKELMREKKQIEIRKDYGNFLRALFCTDLNFSFYSIDYYGMLKLCWCWGVSWLHFLEHLKLNFLLLTFFYHLKKLSQFPLKLFYQACNWSRYL